MSISKRLDILETLTERADPIMMIVKFVSATSEATRATVEGESLTRGDESEADFLKRAMAKAKASPRQPNCAALVLAYES